MAVKIRPVPHAPALRAEASGRRASLLIADLHLGLAAAAERPSGLPEASAERLADRLVELAGREEARTVIIVGDVKHPIVGTPPALRPVVFDFFGRLLEENLAVEIVLGNHDAGLVRHLPREVRVHPPTGAAHDGLGMFHGHTWPSDEVLHCRRWVTGHLHPGYRFAPTADEPGGKRPCWVRTRFPQRPPPRDPGRGPRPAVRELIVLPPFNPLAGIEALNRERPARGRTFLYRRFLAWGVPRAYLLDGTDLGELPRWGTAPDRPRSSGPARRGR